MDMKSITYIKKHGFSVCVRMCLCVYDDFFLGGFYT